ncbi:OB-fold domain-containing protein [Nocardia bovistercoris]|uniref:OB-fold domain-containing protein n=1 Tax=Nocardia bovistercoris TaxID=2785916 RepID=A0A931IBC0_9NOCA|nr:OB-fold domain-containing protein [Nocardia bovistercoris]MBH0776725.1 OB-fold domain-containing protein [Nocardia bovistercoris]
MDTPFSLVGYASYLPRHRLSRAEISAALGSGPGRGARVVAGFDEDSTTMGFEAIRAALRATGADATSAIYFATTSPAYLDKTNACAVHAALGLPASVFAADVGGAARSAVAAWRAAAACGGSVVLADVRGGRPGSADERGGGDGAAAFLFGDADAAIADVLAQASRSLEILDRWRDPASASGDLWEERFGLEEYLPVAGQCVREVLAEAGLDGVDHALVVSPNPAVQKNAAEFGAGARTHISPIGHSGCADLGVGLADVLDQAAPGETILVISVADGCDALLLRTTARLAERRQAIPVRDQLAAGADIGYFTYLSWRGHLDREPPRRPEPDRPAAPPSARARDWKFTFTASRCLACGFVQLPPARVCKKCGSVDETEPIPMADASGVVATYTVDRLAFSPSPPLVDAVVDFDGGGRYTLEVADARPDDLAIGVRADLVFRRLYTAAGVHNYFWKARLRPAPDVESAATVEKAGVSA